VATGSSGSAPRRRRARGPRVQVLRVGHRPGRDPRLTTHVALVARAFGAERLYLHPPDSGVAESLRGVRERWGGLFEVEGVDSWAAVLRGARGPVVHLTMYGLPLARLLPQLRRAKELLVVVGGAKVPGRLYGAATYNVAVGSQPHSEVAALAVLLTELRGLPPARPPAGARQRIVPQARGKRLERLARGNR
jgi:tRNA (cytidine56-2'-O)-methyltransferase